MVLHKMIREGAKTDIRAITCGVSIGTWLYSHSPTDFGQLIVHVGQAKPV